MKKRTSIPAYLILLLAFSQVLAGEVFTWTDAGGLTHFSETPPDDAATGVAQVELPPASPAKPDTDADYYSVINQAARMEARRLENEKLKAERRAAEAAARKARAEEQAALELARQAASLEQPRYYPLYIHYPRSGRWPSRGPRPRHHDRRYPDHRSGYRSSRHRTNPAWPVLSRQARNPSSPD